MCFSTQDNNKELTMKHNEEMLLKSSLTSINDNKKWKKV